MNFHDLRIIVGQIKKNVKCPKCSARYVDEDIELIGGLGDEQHFFHATCNKCESESVVNVSLQFEDNNMVIPHDLMRLGAAPRMGDISADEVLDMHNFLKSFNGDFNSLFNRVE